MGKASFGRMRRSATIVGVVALFVVLAPTNAGAKALPAAQWAPKFCAAISTFQQHLTRDGTHADAVLSGNITSLAGAKATLAGFMSKAVNDADTAISALKRAGTPNAANGSKIAAAFVKGFQTARRLYASARTDAQHLATKTLTGFESSTQKLTADLNKGAKSITASFNNIQALDTSGSVGAAIRAEPACAFLKNS
jgi:hypothetical protein